MRGLFLREDAARAGPDTVTVVAILPLLRALILPACEQPVMWDEDGSVRHVVALALHEIGHAATRPISVPACNDARLRCVTEAFLRTRARRLRRDGRRSTENPRTAVRRETGMNFQAWQRQLRLTEGLAALSNGETPAHIPAKIGYSSGPAFRLLFGITPGRSATRS